MTNWPEKLFDLIYFQSMDEKLKHLSELAEDEDWDFRNTENARPLLILLNYMQNTYSRLAQEGKIEISDDDQYLTFNTGLVTNSQEPIFAYAHKNLHHASRIPWYFKCWKKSGDIEMTKFSKLPEMAEYTESPSVLFFDTSKELRTNFDHIVSANKDRFPEPYKKMGDYPLQNFLRGAIENAKERVKRNYRTAIPHYYKGRVQLLLPLYFDDPNKADLALAVDDHGTFYRACTCLTLEMAYNNARQIVRPEGDWLRP